MKWPKFSEEFDKNLSSWTLWPINTLKIIALFNVQILTKRLQII